MPSKEIAMKIPITQVLEVEFVEMDIALRIGLSTQHDE